MQNRYAGDVGDFGKLGLLRQLTSTRLDIGVNWYLAPDESHNADGKHIGYITDTRYNGCDDSLRESLKEIVNGQRSVSALETMDLVPNAIYYHEVLYSPSRTFSRRDWHTRLQRKNRPWLLWMSWRPNGAGNMPLASRAGGSTGRSFPPCLSIQLKFGR